MHNGYTEEGLLQLLHSGDEKAFTEIYNQYWNKLYFIAHKHLKSPQASEEIVQEVFLQLWHKRVSLQIKSLPQYLAAMTRYAVYTYVAKENRLQYSNGVVEEELISVPGQDDAVNNKLLLEIIEKLSNTLPEKCRLVFVHNKLFDQALPQVARQLHISDKTAEAHLTKALKIIRGNFRKAFSLFFTF